MSRMFQGLLAGWGLLVCVMAMVAAAAVEFYRLRMYHEGRVMPESYTLAGPHDARLQAGSHPEVVRMSVFWQIPQYLLIGLSEVGGLHAECMRRGLVVPLQASCCKRVGPVSDAWFCYAAAGMRNSLTRGARDWTLGFSQMLASSGQLLS